MKTLKKELIAAIVSHDPKQLETALTKIKELREKVAQQAEKFAQLKKEASELITENDDLTDSAVLSTVRPIFHRILNNPIDEPEHPHFQKSPLTLAVEIWPEIIPQLADAGAWLWFPDNHGFTAITKAVTLANTGLITLLINLGASPFEYKKELYSPIEAAINSAHSDEKTCEILEALYKKNLSRKKAMNKKIILLKNFLNLKKNAPTPDQLFFWVLSLP